ncbi:hypothetical protein JTB14_010212 [Gonioctena quinquepunctata]|nr:hypothetical protein JTB14_010212 [Gonioctena quinquepunctata]
MPFPNRPKFAKLHEYFNNYGQNRWVKIGADSFSHSYVKDLETRINDAIFSGAIWNETEGKLVKIESEEFLNVLGNLIEVFYQLIKKLVVIPFQRYLARIPAYTRDELIFNGVEITKVKIDPLITYNEPHYSLLINSVFHGSHDHGNDFNVSVCQQRLNHMPFDTTMNIKSAKAQKASIRIFLGPKYDRDGRLINMKDNRIHYVPIDTFVADLQAGDNVITRKSTDNRFYAPDKVSFHNLWHYTVASLENHEEFTTDLKQNSYGFPMRFMIPKGSPRGTPYQFFFTVQPYIEHPTPLTHNLDMLQIDNYPLGFPLDRHIMYDKMWEQVPNFHFEEVKIFFKEDKHSL